MRIAVLVFFACEKRPARFEVLDDAFVGIENLKARVRSRFGGKVPAAVDRVGRLPNVHRFEVAETGIRVADTTDDRQLSGVPQ